MRITLAKLCKKVYTLFTENVTGNIAVNVLTRGCRMDGNSTNVFISGG